MAGPKLCSQAFMNKYYLFWSNFEHECWNSKNEIDIWGLHGFGTGFSDNLDVYGVSDGDGYGHGWNEYEFQEHP